MAAVHRIHGNEHTVLAEIYGSTSTKVLSICRHMRYADICTVSRPHGSGVQVPGVALQRAACSHQHAAATTIEGRTSPGLRLRLGRSSKPCRGKTAASRHQLALPRPQRRPLELSRSVQGPAAGYAGPAAVDWPRQNGQPQPRKGVSAPLRGQNSLFYFYHEAGPAQRTARQW